MKILAIDIGGTAIKYGITDENFNVCEFYEIPSEAKLGGDHLMLKVLSIVGTYYGGVDCVGISTAGQVNSEEGRIIFANESIPHYTGTEIKKMITEKYDIPVVVENDVNSAATAEAVFGSGKGSNDFLCLTYGTGVGGAVWLGGKLYTGHDFSAGEFGHIVTHTGGLRCNCGNNGCYEMYASTSALIRMVREGTGKELTGREIFEPQNFHNTAIRAIIDNWIDEIVGGLSTLIFIFNPAVIILGGGIMNEDYIISEIDKRIHSKDIRSFKTVQIKKAMLKNRAGMLGAAYLAKKNFDKLPKTKNISERGRFRFCYVLETVDALAAFFNKLIVISICTELSYLLHKHHKLIHFAVIGVNAEQRTFFIPHFFCIVAFSFRFVGVTVFRRSYDLVYRVAHIAANAFQIYVPAYRNRYSRNEHTYGNYQSFHFSLSFLIYLCCRPCQVS